MLWTLLVKDLKRVKANPTGYLLMLAMPIAITAMIGLAVGSSGGGMPQIKVIMVDEDQNLLGGLLGSAFSQGPLKDSILLEATDFDKGMDRLNDNKASALIRIPAGFTEQFLKGEPTPPIDLIKNPAERFLPAIVEEMLLTMNEGLNALARNFKDELAATNELLAQETMPDMLAVTDLSGRIYNRLENASTWVFPPVIQISKSKQEGEKEPDFNPFGLLLPAISALFLMFLADMAFRDLFVEEKMQTLDRFRTLNFHTLPMILSKAILAMAVVLLGAIILLGGAGMMFSIQWEAPLETVLLVLAFGAFSAGFLALVSAIVQTEKKANMVNSGLLMGMGFLGGSMLPAENLPAFVRDHIGPLMPNYWFSRAIIHLQYGMEGPHWVQALLQLAVCGTICLILAAVLMNRRLNKGVRA